MRYQEYPPSPRLQAYVKRFAVSESDEAGSYKVFPSTGLVIGFQFRGRLNVIHASHSEQLSESGITGIADCYQVFENTSGIGTVLVYFTETGFSHFSQHPVHELFNLQLSLDALFPEADIRRVEERLQAATNDKQRIQVVEGFLLAQLRDMQKDRLVVEGVRRIYAAQGNVRIGELIRELAISQSPFEKRFRKVVGTSPKKFASVVRFHTVLSQMGSGMSLVDICYANHYFDQSHFIKDFRQYTGTSPEQFVKGG